MRETYGGAETLGGTTPLGLGMKRGASRMDQLGLAAEKATAGCGKCWQRHYGITALPHNTPAMVVSALLPWPQDHFPVLEGPGYTQEM